MIFAYPMAFWALLLLFPLIILFFLKVRPAKKETTTLFLWDQIFEEKKQNGFLKNFRELLSLLLLVISFIAAILAMAKPSFSLNENKQNLVLIIDNSASMSALTEGNKRIEEAKKTAQNIVDSLNSTQQVIIASVNDDINIITNATSNKRELTKGIEAINESQLPLNLPALKSLASNSSGINNSRIIFISDGSAAGTETLSEVELFKVGREIENIGLISCDIARSLTAVGTCDIFYQLVSTFSAEQEVDLVICNGTKDNVVKVVPTQVKAGLNAPVIFNIPIMASDRWFISIDKSDDLALDNNAYLVLPKQLPFRLQMFGSDAFLGFCVEAFARSGNLMQAVEENPEVNFCINSVDKSSTPKIIFSPDGESKFWKGLGSETDSLGKVIVKDHPLVKMIDWESFEFVGAKNIEAPVNSVVLVENEEHVPLLYKTSVDGTVAIVVNMNLEKAMIYFSVNFPVMCYSMAKDLVVRDANSKINLAMGDAFINDQGENETPSQSGFIKNGDNDFAYSLVNKQESEANNSLSKHNVNSIKADVPLTNLFIIIALVVIAIESALYQQRKVG